MDFDQCSVYLLDNGEFYNISLTLANQAIFITNCSNYTESLAQYQTLAASLDPDFFSSTRDIFGSGIISVAFAFSSLVCSAWMLEIVLVLSVNKKPFFTHLSALLYAAFITVVMAKTNSIIGSQYSSGYQDIEEFYEEVINSIWFKVLYIIVQLVTWIAWLDILIYIHSMRLRPFIKRIGGAVIFVDTLFHCLELFLTDRNLLSDTFSGVGIVSILFKFLIFISFYGLFIVFTVQKRKFAYHGRLIPLACMTLLFMVITFTFYLLFRFHDTLKSWTVISVGFGQVLLAIMIWEWIRGIESLEKDLETKTIVGRAMSDIEFTDFDRRNAAATLSARSRRFRMWHRNRASEASQANLDSSWDQQTDDFSSFNSYQSEQQDLQHEYRPTDARAPMQDYA